MERPPREKRARWKRLVDTTRLRDGPRSDSPRWTRSLGPGQGFYLGAQSVQPSTLKLESCTRANEPARREESAHELLAAGFDLLTLKAERVGKRRTTARSKSRPGTPIEPARAHTAGECPLGARWSAMTVVLGKQEVAYGCCRRVGRARALCSCCRLFRRAKVG